MYAKRKAKHLRTSIQISYRKIFEDNIEDIDTRGQAIATMDKVIDTSLEEMDFLYSIYTYGKSAVATVITAITLTGLWAAFK